MFFRRRRLFLPDKVPGGVAARKVLLSVAWRVCSPKRRTGKPQKPHGSAAELWRVLLFVFFLYNQNDVQMLKSLPLSPEHPCHALNTEQIEDEGFEAVAAGEVEGVEPMAGQTGTLTREAAERDLYVGGVEPVRLFVACAPVFLCAPALRAPVFLWAPTLRAPVMSLHIPSQHPEYCEVGVEQVAEIGGGGVGGDAVGIPAVDVGAVGGGGHAAGTGDGQRYGVGILERAALGEPQTVEQTTPEDLVPRIGVGVAAGSQPPVAERVVHVLVGPQGGVSVGPSLTSHTVLYHVVLGVGEERLKKYRVEKNK